MVADAAPNLLVRTRMACPVVRFAACRIEIEGRRESLLQASTSAMGVSSGAGLASGTSEAIDWRWHAQLVDTHPALQATVAWLARGARVRSVWRWGRRYPHINILLCSADPTSRMP